MAEKSDGESEDSIQEKIRQLEKKKKDLERKRSVKEEKNSERKRLEQRLRELQGEVTDLQDHADQRGSELSPLGDSRDRLRALQNQLFDNNPGPSSLRSHKRKDDIPESSSEDDVEDVMSLRHKQALQMNRDVLVENMISDDIFNDLIANKILTTADVSRIKEKNTREAVNEELLNNLLCRSDRAFHVFVRSLRKNLQDYLANRIDPGSSAKKKKRKRKQGELNVNVDCDEVTPLNKRQSVCTCQEVEEQILVMAKTAYRNIRRRNDTPAAFEQFRKELKETNQVVKDSMEIMHTLKILCRHGDMSDISNGSIRFTLLCSSVFVVKDLWKMYKSGELLRIFQNGLVTRSLRLHCGAKSIRLRVRIAEIEYQQCLAELESQPNYSVICDKPKVKKLRTSTPRTRSRKLKISSENIPLESFGKPLSTAGEIMKNPRVISPENAKSASPRIPFYELRNRPQNVLCS